MTAFFRASLAGTCSILALALPQGVYAQEASPSATTSDEIVVTARRREETLLSVPVSVTAVSNEQLQNRGITNLMALSTTVPGLILGNSAGGFQGSTLSLRGISSIDNNNIGDQALSFYIDGVAVARSTPARLAELDMEQIEILKGPQALYYGKNSPGGVIVLRSADPGDTFEAKAQVGYEFEGREIRGQGFISTPLTSSLGLRVAIGGAKMRGWARNIVTPGTPYEPPSRWASKSREINGRATLKYDGGPFTARLKFAYSRLKNDGFAGNTQFINCPLGYPANSPPPGPNDCKADDKLIIPSGGTRPGSGGVNTVTGAPIQAFAPFRDGDQFARIRQIITGLELNYDVSDNLVLSSITGLFDANIETVHIGPGDTTFAFNPLAGPAGVGGMNLNYASIKIREISEEVRLTSDFSGPVNFMVGAYFQDQKVDQSVTSIANLLNPIYFAPPLRVRQKNQPYSFFGSVSVKPTEQLELSGGIRYSHEKKKIRFNRIQAGVLPASQGGAPFVAGQEVPTLRPSRSFSNWSPEVTATWRPTPDLTVYGGWKRGFLSGGFNGSSGGTGVAILPDRSYGLQIVEGFEAGIKARALDDKVQVTLAAFSYKISGMQSSRSDPATASVIIANAASARTKGIELDGKFRPVAGLTLNGGVSYIRARYLRYDTGPCYGGQSIEAGCNLGLNAAGTAFTQQDLSGQPLVRAPEWSIVAGANYETEISPGNVLGLSVNANYRSWMNADTANKPQARISGFWLLDASARYEVGNVEFAVIGRNLTNKYYWDRTADGVLSGRGTGTATAIPADTTAQISRGRELWVRATYRY